jgi:hypothetical protein
MKHIKQTNPFDCGQICLAMLTSKRMEEIYKIVGHKRGTHGTELSKILRRLGYSTTKRLKIFKGKLPKKGLLWCRVKDGIRRHWVLFARDYYYDPASQSKEKELNSNLTITHFLPIGVQNNESMD